MKGRENKTHIIGPFEAPIYACTKKEANELMTDSFKYCYECWDFYRNGFGLPGGLNYTEYDIDFVEIIKGMCNLYDRYFSKDETTRQYLEAVIKCLKAGFNLK
jgi:hypothetical protein